MLKNMKYKSAKLTLIIVMLLAVTISCNATGSTKAEASVAGALSGKTVHDFTVIDIDGKEVSLSQYKGKIVVIVNTASQCGLVGQFSELEAFYKKYKDKGIVVLGFPENNFMGQEPLNDAEIKSFCTKNYGVTFPMFSKISVKGKDIAPLYKYLTDKNENGVLDAPIKWNYQKFIIDRKGNIVASVAPRTSVNDPEFIQYIEDLLK